MNRFRERELRYFFVSGFLRLAWTEWGDEAAPVVVCLHGLTRNGRDFDILAQALNSEFRVICPDLPGRGRSEWLPQPAMYAVPSYLQALSHLLARIDRPAAWVGTSLGGICGMALAAVPGQPLTRLVLNDVGPFIPAAALQRIADYLAAAPASFANPTELEAALRRVHAPFGALSDAQWAALARHSGRAQPDGRVALHYDPAIAAQLLASPPADVDLWPVWDRIDIPRLVLRGEASDLLLPETLARMAADGAATHVVAGAGHAPALMDEPTIAVVRSFLHGA